MPFWGQVAVALLASWVVRAAYLAFLPEGVGSLDLSSWVKVAVLMGRGQNPYNSTLLNWPPLWMQVLYALFALSQVTSLRFTLLLRVFLILVESLLTVQAARLMRRLYPRSSPLVPLLLGFSLNPFQVLLTVQHCNFDALVMLWVLLALEGLVLFVQRDDAVDWLIGCFFLGLGVLTKTVPLALAPLWCVRLRRLAFRTRLLGAALVAGPAALGVSVLYVLAPRVTLMTVIAYRSVWGTYGVAGLLRYANLLTAMRVYGNLYTLFLAGALAAVAVRAWRKGMGAGELLLVAALTMTAVVALAPGFGWQYLQWPMSLLVVTAPGHGRLWRRTLLAALTVVSLTAVVAYSTVWYLGNLLGHLRPDDPTFVDWTAALSSPAGFTFLTLPVLLSLLGILGVGVHLLRRERAYATAGT